MAVELTESERDNLASKWIQQWDDDKISFDKLVEKLASLKEAKIAASDPEKEEEDPLDI